VAVHIGADPVGPAVWTPQKFGYGGLLYLGPHENFTEKKFNVSKIDTRSSFVSL